MVRLGAVPAAAFVTSPPRRKTKVPASETEVAAIQIKVPAIPIEILIQSSSFPWPQRCLHAKSPWQLMWSGEDVEFFWICKTTCQSGATLLSPANARAVSASTAARQLLPRSRAARQPAHAHNRLLTIFCPCITFGRIANIVDQGATSCCVSGTLYLLLSAWTGGQPSVLTGGLSCLYSCCYRSRLRSQYGLPEGPCNCPDCCVHFWCEPCALCQEYRELKARGFDMSEAWERNMERMGKAGAATAPPQRCIQECRVRASIRMWQMQPAACRRPPSVLASSFPGGVHFDVCRVFVSTYVFGVVIIVRNHNLKIHA